MEKRLSNVHAATKETIGRMRVAAMEPSISMENQSMKESGKLRKWMEKE